MRHCRATLGQRWTPIPLAVSKQPEIRQEPAPHTSNTVRSTASEATDGNRLPGRDLRFHPSTIRALPIWRGRDDLALGGTGLVRRVQAHRTRRRWLVGLRKPNAIRPMCLTMRLCPRWRRWKPGADSGDHRLLPAVDGGGQGMDLRNAAGPGEGVERLQGGPDLVGQRAGVGAGQHVPQQSLVIQAAVMSPPGSKPASWRHSVSRCSSVRRSAPLRAGGG